jgi:hypothetical protein
MQVVKISGPIGLSLRSRNELHPQKLFLGLILGCSRIFGWPASDSSIRLPPDPTQSLDTLSTVGKLTLT